MSKESHSVESLLSCEFCVYKFSLQQHLVKHQLGFVIFSIFRTFIGVAKSRFTSLLSDYRHGLNNHHSKKQIWLFGV